MKETTIAGRLIAVLAIGLLAAVTACEQEEPPRPGFDNYDPEEVKVKPDQTALNTCVGEETDEEPDFDLALDLTENGEIREFHVTVAEKKGLRVCTVKLRIQHNTQNPETGAWEYDGQSAIVVVLRVEPGEPLERVTRVYSGEFPNVTELGPPEAWTVTVDSYSDVRKP